MDNAAVSQSGARVPVFHPHASARGLIDQFLNRTQEKGPDDYIIKHAWVLLIYA
jgi:hypothetical protein